MAKLNYLDGTAPNDPTVKLTQPGWSMKRGKIVPAAKVSWGNQTANGAIADADLAEAGRQVLDEALGD